MGPSIARAMLRAARAARAAPLGRHCGTVAPKKPTTQAVPSPASTTPVMKQFFQIRNDPQYDGHLLLFQMGQFLEALHDDAKVLSSAAGVALTSRGTHNGAPIPMAGIPLHAADAYIAKLVRAGLKVAVCEQIDGVGHISVSLRQKEAEGGTAASSSPGPKSTTGWSPSPLMRRQVTRIVTRGTIVDDSLLTPRSRNYIAALAPGRAAASAEAPQTSGSTPLGVGVAWLDLSTGDFFTRLCTPANLSEQLAAYPPSELVIPRRGSRSDSLSSKEPLPPSATHSASPLSIEELSGLLDGVQPGESLLLNIARQFGRHSAALEPRVAAVPPRIELPGADTDCSISFVDVGTFSVPLSDEPGLHLGASSPTQQGPGPGIRREDTRALVSGMLAHLQGPEHQAAAGLLHYVLWTQQGRLPALRPVVSLQVSGGEEGAVSPLAPEGGRSGPSPAADDTVAIPGVQTTAQPAATSSSSAVGLPSSPPSAIASSSSLYIDPHARRALELTRPMQGRRRARGSLLHTLDRCVCAMGSRMMDQRLCSPLASALPIAHRHDAVGFLVDRPMLRESIRDTLGLMPDAERALMRVSLWRAGSAVTRDLVAIRDGLAAAQRIGLLLASGDHVTWHPSTGGLSDRRNRGSPPADVLLSSIPTPLALSTTTPTTSSNMELAAAACLEGLANVGLMQQRAPVSLQEVSPLNPAAAHQGAALNEWARCEFDILAHPTTPPVAAAATGMDAGYARSLCASAAVLARCSAALLQPLAASGGGLANSSSARLLMLADGGALADAFDTLRRALPSSAQPSSPSSSSSPSPSGDDDPSDGAGEETGPATPELQDAAPSGEEVGGDRGGGRSNQISGSDPVLASGDVILPGYSAELDAARGLRDDASSAVAALEGRLRALTGIRALRVRRTDIYGHVAEVPAKALAAMEAVMAAARGHGGARQANPSTGPLGDMQAAPPQLPRFHLVRSLKASSRYKCGELEALDAALSQAALRAEALQARLLRELVEGVLAARGAIATVARAVAVVDVTAALAEVAGLYHLTRPLMTEEGVPISAFSRPTVGGAEAGGLGCNELLVANARHLVVERALMESWATEWGTAPLTSPEGFADRRLPEGGSRVVPRAFTPNSIALGGGDPGAGVGDPGSRVRPSTALICGPNMGGKSTYLRSAAQLVVLAHMGSFVPADAGARIGVVDRLFSRVGANDDVSRDRSTFLVEMEETATILRHATRKSLVVIDEVGRGTSAVDGLAIAWSVLEHLSTRTGCRTLFATHIHELVAIAAAPALRLLEAGDRDRPPQGGCSGGGAPQLLLPVDCLSVAVEASPQGPVLTHRIVQHPIYRHPAMRAAALGSSPHEAGLATAPASPIDWHDLSSQSYGVHVAAMAGLPPSLLQRARGILDRLDTARVTRDWARAVVGHVGAAK